VSNTAHTRSIKSEAIALYTWSEVAFELLSTLSNRMPLLALPHVNECLGQAPSSLVETEKIVDQLVGANWLDRYTLDLSIPGEPKRLHLVSSETATQTVLDSHVLITPTRQTLNFFGSDFRLPRAICDFEVMMAWSRLFTSIQRETADVIWSQSPKNPDREPLPPHIQYLDDNQNPIIAVRRFCIGNRQLEKLQHHCDQTKLLLELWS